MQPKEFQKIFLYAIKNMNMKYGSVSGSGARQPDQHQRHRKNVIH